MGRMKRILVLAGLLAVILIVPASPTLGDEAVSPLQSCAELAFSTEEDFLTRGSSPLDGNPLISDGDLLGKNCVVCLRNAQLLTVFEVEEDLGLDAADVINVDAGLVAFSTELDHPRGAFKAGDLLTTHGAVIPNVALLYQFDLPAIDLGLDAVHFVGDPQGINAFLNYSSGVGREEWLNYPSMLSGILEEFQIDLWFSTEGTGPWPEDPVFLDGDLLSAGDGVIVAGNDVLLLASVPASILERGVDFGLDAATADRGGTQEMISFSTEILFNGEPAFTDGYVLLQAGGPIGTNQDLTGCFEPLADDLGLDALFLKVGEAPQDVSKALGAPSRLSLPRTAREPVSAPAMPSVKKATDARSNDEDYRDTLCGLFPFACRTRYDSDNHEASVYSLEQLPMPACSERAFSTEEEFLTDGAVPSDGNPIISDGDLLGENCVVCARNRQLLQAFNVEFDLGLDAADVIDVATGLVAFSTELDDPSGQFTAGDLLTTNGMVIPNQALLWTFEIDYDMGLDAVYFVGPQESVVQFLQDVRDLTREQWLIAPHKLAARLAANGVDLWFSTEGTALPVDKPEFLDGDLLSAVDGTIVEAQHDLLPAPDVPAGLPDRGVDFGLDAVSGDRSDPEERLRFSTEILYNNELSFTDGDVLFLGNGVEWTNADLILPCEAAADFLGLDAYSIGPPCQPSIEVQKQVWQEAEEVITPVDIVFAFDATASMGDEIDEVKSSATQIMNGIRAVIADSQFGLASFADYPNAYTDYCGYSGEYGDPGVPDWPYRLDQSLTTDIVAVQGAIGALTLGQGGDWAEDYTRALWELGVNDVVDVGWRPGATKIVIMFGDAWTHDCGFYATSSGGDPGIDEIADTADDLDFGAVVAQLAANDVIVLSVDSSNEPGGDAEKSFKHMAYQTDGAYYALPDAGEIPKAVRELVTSVFGEWVDEITTVISDTVRFRCTIHNNGTGCPLSNIVATDLLPPSLEYRDNATVNGEPWEPVEVAPKEFEWDLGDWMLDPSETIEIEFDAHVTKCGVDVNFQEVTAIGGVETVSASDTATVTVPCVDNEVYLEPKDSSALFCTITEVEVWVNATDFQGGQMKLRYDADCAEVTDWQRNTDDFLYGTWDSDTPGEEWITFSGTGEMTGEYLVGTLIIHCVDEDGCSTDLHFVVDGVGTSKLVDELGNEVLATWEDGVFTCRLGTCGDVAPAAACDGVVDVKDPTLLLNHVGYPGDYSLCCDACGDVAPSEGCDGVIDVGDFILLLNYVRYPGQYDLCCEGEAAATAPAARAMVLAGGAAAAESEVTFFAQDSSAPYGKSTEVEIWADAPDFQSGQIKFTYDSTCADVIDWQRNTDDFLYGGWESDTPGEEWIVFIAEGPLSGEHLVGTLTIHCVSEEDCATALDFVEPSLLSDDFGNDVPATWVAGTFHRD